MLYYPCKRVVASEYEFPLFVGKSFPTVKALAINSQRVQGSTIHPSTPSHPSGIPHPLSLCNHAHPLCTAHNTASNSSPIASPISLSPIPSYNSTLNPYHPTISLEHSPPTISLRAISLSFVCLPRSSLLYLRLPINFPP